MLDVSAVVVSRKHAEKAEAADGAPANEFDETVGGIGLWGDEHSAAGVFAVVESEKEAATFVPVCVTVAAQGEGGATQLDHAGENSEQIADSTERLEHAVRESGNVSGEADAQ